MGTVTDRRPPRTILTLGLSLVFLCLNAGVVRGQSASTDREELGYRLFFDPVLSTGQQRSCASCHQPSKGFTDGRQRALSRSGQPQKRNTLTLYNVAVHDRFFWDARVDRLEEAVRVPLVSPDELGADPRSLVRRLKAHKAYRRRFHRAFPEDPNPISMKNLSNALAAFLRSMSSLDAPFDRYKNGREDALSPAQKRGLKLFHSLRTRCFECHPPPSFTSLAPRSIGVPGSDGGVEERTGNPAQTGQFRVPTLRNVALTAPYMHDGSFETLREVVEFYAEGGGRAHGMNPRHIAPEVKPFPASDSDIRDLVAFMHALTDTSARAEKPHTVPSGLPPGGKR